jgi:hypothetical protein
MERMQGEQPSRRELVAAMFSSEFVDGGIDPDVLRRVHAGEHEEGLNALDRSGVFGKEALTDLADIWRRDPVSCWRRCCRRPTTSRGGAASRPGPVWTTAPTAPAGHRSAEPPGGRHPLI